MREPDVMKRAQKLILTRSSEQLSVYMAGDKTTGGDEFKELRDRGLGRVM